MRLSLASLLLATGALAFAGCLGAPAAQEQPVPTAAPPQQEAELPEVKTPQPPVPEPHVQVFPFDGRITAGAGQPGVGYLAPFGAQDTHAYGFDVAEGAAAIVVELRWQDKTADLDLELASPSCDITTGTGACLYAQEGSPGAGDTPMRFVVTDPTMLNMTGQWGIYVWAKSAVNAPFDGVLSVFYHIAPSDDYTALQ